MSAPPLSLKGRAVQWLSQREHSRQELRRKLLTHLRNAARREAARAAEAPTRASARSASRRDALATADASELGAPPVVDRGVARRRGRHDADAFAPPDVESATDTDAEDADPTAAFDAQVDEVLDWLVAHRYLSEARFVESRVHVRGARYGNLRIKQELAQHGVALTVEQSQHLHSTEFDRALAVWSRKFGAAPVDLRERAKQMRFMAARGFSMPVIARVLKQAPSPSGNVASDGEHDLNWEDAAD